jgi:predicted ATPase
MGHRQMGVSLMLTGDIAEARAHFDRAVALFDHADRPLVTGTGKELWVYILADRSTALWTLGYPEAALADTRRAVKDGHDLGRGASLAYAAAIASRVFLFCGEYAAANAQLDESIVWAHEKGAVFWEAFVTLSKGSVAALTGKASDAVRTITSAIATWRSTGSTAFMPLYLSDLAIAYMNNGQFDDAYRCVGEAVTAMETTKEKWCEAEVNRMAGEIALRSPAGDLLKAQAYFERALALAQQQQAKSWELRAAMSLARLWRDQGKVSDARDLLAPVYGWFTEGFDTRDLKEAKALLEELA